MSKQMVYASALMTAREVHEACKDFREQEARVRRKAFRVVNNKEASVTLPSSSGYFFDRTPNGACSHDITET